MPLSVDRLQLLSHEKFEPGGGKLGFWNGIFFLIVTFPDNYLLVPLYVIRVRMASSRSLRCHHVMLVEMFLLSFEVYDA